MKRAISIVLALAAGIFVAASYKNGWWLDKAIVGGATFSAIYLGLNGWAKFLYELSKQKDL